MSRNPSDQLKALSERRARDRADQEGEWMLYGLEDTQPIAVISRPDAARTEQ